MRKIDAVGMRFGRLVIVRLISRARHGARWECLCDCGKTKSVEWVSLKQGNTKSCGCLQKELLAERSRENFISKRGIFAPDFIRPSTHRMSKTPIYHIWASMLSRCSNAKDRAYKYYGGRGIRVCERWHSFENFFSDMGERPQGLTLDRFPDNNGNYGPGNCRWATRQEQVLNTRQNVFIEYQGERITISQCAERSGIDRGTLSARMARGVTGDALFKSPKYTHTQRARL